MIQELKVTLMGTLCEIGLWSHCVHHLMRVIVRATLSVMVIGPDVSQICAISEVSDGHNHNCGFWGAKSVPPEEEKSVCGSQWAMRKWPDREVTLIPLSEKMTVLPCQTNQPALIMCLENHDTYRTSCKVSTASPIWR